MIAWRRLSFGLRLGLFLAALLLALQLFNALAQYGAVRNAIVGRSGAELVQAADIFRAQLDGLAARTAEAARILSLDYAIREAITAPDPETTRSVLRNVQQRLNASHALWMTPDGSVLVDSRTDAGAPVATTPFPFAALLDAPARRQAASAIAVVDADPWLVAVTPVLAPLHLGTVAVFGGLTDATVLQLRDLSPVPLHVSLAIGDGAGGWILGPSTLAAAGRAAVPVELARLGLDRPTVVELEGDDTVMLLTPVATPDGSPPLALLLHYSVSDALADYRPLVFSMLGLLAGGLAIGLLGASLLARTVARPVTELAAAAARVEGGDYTVPVETVGGGEFARLAQAFRRMADAVGERERRIDHQANHDALTGLPNRQGLERWLSRLLAAAPAGTRLPVAVAVIGLERLPEVNNLLGHRVGDRAIAVTANRLAEALGHDDLLARVFDVAFAVVITGADDRERDHVVDRLLVAAERPIVLDEAVLDLIVKVGLVQEVTADLTAAEVLRRADVALFTAQTSDNLVEAYAPERDPDATHRLSLMSELRSGVAAGELRLLYQPKLDLATGRICGVEALVRWTHPRHGPLSPDRFIPLAEETGTIRHLTRWAVERAVADVRSWEAAGVDLAVAVNVSARDPTDSGFPLGVETLLRQSGLPPSRLTLEITESAVMRDLDAAIRVIARLKSAGVRLSVDDFGTGQSSLTYLRRLPVDELKVDRSFVQDIARSPRDEVLVRSIVDLAGALQLSVVAEGVESEETLRLLARIGCQIGQGYFIGRPIAAAEIPTFARSFAAGVAHIAET